MSAPRSLLATTTTTRNPTLSSLLLSLFFISGLISPSFVNAFNAGNIPSTWQYVGCVYEGINNRILTQDFTWSFDQTPSRCIQSCGGTKYVALEMGTQCFCGDSISSIVIVSDNLCNYKCGSDSSSSSWSSDTIMCGGYGYMSLYSQKPPAPPPPPAPLTTSTPPPPASSTLKVDTPTPNNPPSTSQTQNQNQNTPQVQSSSSNGSPNQASTSPIGSSAGQPAIMTSIPPGAFATTITVSGSAQVTLIPFSMASTASLPNSSGSQRIMPSLQLPNAGGSVHSLGPGESGSANAENAGVWTMPSGTPQFKDGAQAVVFGAVASGALDVLPSRTTLVAAVMTCFFLIFDL